MIHKKRTPVSALSLGVAEDCPSSEVASAAGGYQVLWGILPAFASRYDVVDCVGVVVAPVAQVAVAGEYC